VSIEASHVRPEWVARNAVIMRVHLIILLTCLFLFVAPSPAQSLQLRETSQSGPVSQATVPDLQNIVQRIEAAQEANRQQLPYETIRTYRFFAGASQVNAEVMARVVFMPPNVKTYSIEKQTGSSRGAEVVRRILDKESSMTAQDPDGSLRAISPENYNFAYLGDDELNDRPCFKLKITPKHKDINLIEGEVWVDQESYLIPRIAGEMSKTPSWWLKKVYLTLDFGSLGGAWQQTGAQATADVRLLGRRSLVSKVVEYRSGELVAFGRKPAGVPAPVLRRRVRSSAASFPIR
jgi:hypothetical protein